MSDYLTIAEAAALLRRKAISPVELTKDCLRRIALLDPALHAFILVTEEHALAQARDAESAIMASGPRSPMHGIPIGIKDIIDTKGIATSCCSAQLIDNVPDADATAVRKLNDAGAVLMGKLTTHEFAFGGPSFDLPWPPPRNPWNVEHFTGGSSSGAGAAIPTGMVLGALGTDTGGSLRGPAALCGIVGCKPTYGRVSRAGIAPAAFSLDHVGPMAWTVADCAILLQSVAGHDPDDPTSASMPVPDFSRDIACGVKGIKIGLVHRFHEVDSTVSEATQQGFDDAVTVFGEMGAELHRVDLPPLREWAACGWIISTCERAGAYESLMRTHLHKFGRRLQNRLLASVLITGADYVQAMRRRRELCFELAEAMRDVDVLMTVVQPREAPRLDATPASADMERPNFTMPFNVAGYPAISVCSGLGKLGLPVALQLVAKPFQEVLLFRVAHAYESATGWRDRRPQLDCVGASPSLPPAVTGPDTG